MKQMTMPRLSTCLPFLVVMTSLAGCTIHGPAEKIPKMVAPKDPVDVGVFAAKTADGVSLLVRRYHLKGRDSSVAAVVLFHGLGYNANIWDLDERSSAARFLALKGYDIFVPGFRGSSSDAAARGYSLDDWALKDVPAVLKSVRAKSAAGRIFLVGHGFGGSAVLRYMGAHPDEPAVAGLVLVGCGVTYPQPPDLVMRKEENLKTCLFEPAQRFGMLLDDDSVRVPEAWQHVFFNVQNMSRTRLFLLLTRGSCVVSPEAASQVVKLVEMGKLFSLDGAVDYSAKLQAVRVPLMVMAGTVDNIAFPEAVRYIYKQAGSKDKTFRLFSWANGDGTDFGNADLVVGLNARKVVLREIEQWMAARCRRPRGRAGATSAADTAEGKK